MVEESSRVGESMKKAIAAASEEELRSAILKVCAQVPEASRLFETLLPLAPELQLENKRKRSVEICEDCGTEVDDYGDNCCKSRRMRSAR